MAISQRELYYQEARDALNRQSELISAYVSRASTLLAFGGALVGAGTLVLNLSEGSVSYLNIGLFSWLFCMFASVVVSCLLVILPRAWVSGPATEDIREFLEEDVYDDEGMLKWTSDRYQESIASNDERVRNRSTWLKIGVWGLVAESTALASLALVVYLSR